MTVTLTTSASSTSVTGIASTGDSHFAVVWEEASTFIRGRIITGDGQTASDRFDVNPDGFATLPSVTTSGDREDPGFAVAWIDLTTRQVKMRIFHGIDGGDEILVSSGGVRLEDRPVIARLDNQIVVAWATGGLGGEGVRAAFFNPQGDRLGEVRIDNGTAVNIGPLVGTALTNDTFAILWQGGDNLAGVRPRVQILKPDQTKLGPEKLPNLSGRGDMSMAVLFPSIAEERGEFVVARISGTRAVANLFTIDGTEFQETNVNPPPAGVKVAGEPDVAAIQVDGLAKYVVVWRERRTDGDGTGENVHVRTFAELLDPGPVLTIGADGLGNQTKPSIATNDFLGAVGIAYLDDKVPGVTPGECAVQATTIIF